MNAGINYPALAVLIGLFLLDLAAAIALIYIAGELANNLL